MTSTLEVAAAQGLLTVHWKALVPGANPVAAMPGSVVPESVAGVPATCVQVPEPDVGVSAKRVASLPFVREQSLIKRFTPTVTWRPKQAPKLSKM